MACENCRMMRRQLRVLSKLYEAMVISRDEALRKEKRIEVMVKNLKKEAEMTILKEKRDSK